MQPSLKAHRIGPSPKKRTSKLKVINEENGKFQEKQHIISNEQSFFNDSNILSNTSEVNMNYSLHLPRETHCSRQVKKAEFFPFRNIDNNNSQVVIINHQKFIKSKSPKQSAVRVSSPSQKVRIERVSEKEENLLRKIRILQNRITELHREKQEFTLKMNEERHRLREQAKRKERAHTPIKQINCIYDEEKDKKVQSLEARNDNLEKKLKQMKGRCEKLEEQNRKLRQQEQKYKSTESKSEIQNNSRVSEIRLESFDNFQVRIKELQNELSSKIAQNQSLKFINDQLECQIKKRENQIEKLINGANEKEQNSKKMIELVEMNKESELEGIKENLILVKQQNYDLKAKLQALEKEKHVEKEEDGCSKCKELMETFFKFNSQSHE